MNSKRIIALIIVLALAIGGLASVKLSLGNKDVVALVGNEKITKDDLYDFLVKANGSNALDVLIINKIIELESKRKISRLPRMKSMNKKTRWLKAWEGKMLTNQPFSFMGYRKMT